MWNAKLLSAAIPSISLCGYSPHRACITSARWEARGLPRFLFVRSWLGKLFGSRAIMESAADQSRLPHHVTKRPLRVKSDPYCFCKLLVNVVRLMNREISILTTWLIWRNKTAAPIRVSSVYDRGLRPDGRFIVRFCFCFGLRSYVKWPGTWAGQESTQYLSAETALFSVKRP